MIGAATFIFFVLGALAASFIGVVVGRLGTEQSIARGRSRCDACNEPLPWYALVPLVSYATLRGRAHCCGVRLSTAAPWSELCLGILYALSVSRLGLTLALLVILLALSSLFALVLYDLAHQILPPILLGFFLVAAACFRFIESDVGGFLILLPHALGIGAFLFAIHLMSRGRAMGFSDAPLAFALALLVGEFAWSGLVYSFWIGAGTGIVLLAQRPHGSRMGIEVPFAPYLAAGFLLAYFTEWNLFTLIHTLPGA